MNKIKIDEKFIGKDEPCFIVAEAGINHNGNLKIAKKLGEGKRVVTILPDTGERYLSMERQFES